MTEAYEPFRQILNKAAGYADAKIWVADAFVSQYRKSDRKVKVKLSVGDQETDWLRTMALGTGENFIHCGFESGQDVVVVFFGSLTDGVVIGGFADGSAVNDLDITLSHKSGANITLSDNKIIVEASNVEVNASNASINANSVSLAGGGFGVARIGDKVATAFGPAPIVSGSAKVTSG